MDSQTTSLIDFSFQSRSVRIVEKDGEPWFVAKDVAEALGYVWEGSKSIRHVPEEWQGVYSVYTPRGNSKLPLSEEWKGAIPISSPGGIQEMLCISEPGLYFFLGRSDKPLALPFQKWIAGDVVPSLHKKGFYALPGKDREEQEEWKKNFPYPFLLTETAAVKMREMRLAVAKGLLSPLEYRKTVLGDFARPYKADAGIIDFARENLTITGNPKDIESMADIYGCYEKQTASPYTRQRFTRELCKQYPALTYKQKKIDGYPVLVLFGCKLKKAKKAAAPAPMGGPMEGAAHA